MLTIFMFYLGLEMLPTRQAARGGPLGRAAIRDEWCEVMAEIDAATAKSKLSKPCIFNGLPTGTDPILTSTDKAAKEAAEEAAQEAAPLQSEKQ